MGNILVFLDSDVIISALLSSKGASFKIINNSKIYKVISQTVAFEIEEVTKKLNISLSRSNVFQGIETRRLNLGKTRLANDYFRYVIDQEDSHVVAGADEAKVKFLLTHNLKHYKIEAIKKDLSIITMKPGHFLQYLRLN